MGRWRGSDKQTPGHQGNRVRKLVHRKGCQQATFTLSGSLKPPLSPPHWETYREEESKWSFDDFWTWQYSTRYKTQGFFLVLIFLAIFFLFLVKSDVNQALSFLLICFFTLATSRFDFLTLMLLNLTVIYSGVGFFPLLSLLFGNMWVFLIRCVSSLLLVNSWVFYQTFFLSFTHISPSGSSVIHVWLSPLLSSVSFKFFFFFLCLLFVCWENLLTWSSNSWIYFWDVSALLHIYEVLWSTIFSLDIRLISLYNL